MDHCITCASTRKCKDALKNGHLIWCPYFGDLSKLATLSNHDSGETCRNCKHYHDTLEGEGGFHIHDYCDAWMAQIPNSIIFDRLGLDNGYDDIECGLAGCRAFKRKDGSIQTKFLKSLKST